MKPKLKYFLTSFIGATVIFFAGMYLVDHFEGTTVASVLALISLIITAMLGWISLMAKLILR